MPIKDKSLYPPNWREIRDATLERDGHRCKVCGLPNHAWIQRHNGWVATTDGTVMFDSGDTCSDQGVIELFPAKKWTLVVLTIAHINHDTTDNRPENLAALCQLHHLRHDAEQHKASRAETRRRKHAKV